MNRQRRAAVGRPQTANVKKQKKRKLADRSRRSPLNEFDDRFEDDDIVKSQPTATDLDEKQPEKVKRRNSTSRREYPKSGKNPVDVLIKDKEDSNKDQKVVVDFACSKPNQEVEFSYALTLNQRALILVQTDDYLYKVKEIKRGNNKIKSMEFIMDGIKIELPYLGTKVTQGYLKKETQNGIFGGTF